MSYVVVGCNSCSALWIITGEAETAGCPRCGKRHQVDRLRHLAEADTKPDATELRAQILAERQDATEAFDSVPHVEQLESDLDDAGVDDHTYLAESGIDPDTVQNATDRDATSKSREEIIYTAIEREPAPTKSAIIEYARNREVDPEYTQKALRKLIDRGEIIETETGYRRV